MNAARAILAALAFAATLALGAAPAGAADVAHDALALSAKLVTFYADRFVIEGDEGVHFERRLFHALFATEDKTVAAALSEDSLREMNEGFAAPSTFSEKAPTHKEGQPVSLRQTVMGIGETPPVRPAPLPPPGRSTGTFGAAPAPPAHSPRVPRHRARSVRRGFGGR